MKRFILCVLLLVLTGCMNQTSTIDGKAYFVNEDEQTFVLRIGTPTTDEVKQDYGENDEVIEAIRVEMDEETKFLGVVNSVGDLKSHQKAEVVVEGDYNKELVSPEAYVDQTEEIPTYVADQVQVATYTKEEVIESMTADEDEYHFYVYNPVEKSDGAVGSYSDVIEGSAISEVSIYPSFTNGPDNKREFLNIAEKGPTYIVMDNEGIVHHSYDLKELTEFVETLREDE